MNDSQTQRTTPQDRRLIAEWVRQIRPAWDTPGIMAALRQRADATPARLALAALACAASRDAKFPNVIAMDGAHWRVGEDHTPADRHPSHITVNDMCWTCSYGRSAHPRPGCDGFQQDHTPVGQPYAEHVAAARAAIATGREQHHANDTRQNNNREAAR